MKLLLASNSPRRRELISMLDIDMEIVAPRDVDESYPNDLPVESVPAYLSRVKADAYKDLPKEDEIVVTADTVVIIDNIILGKPHSRDEAVDMLTLLSGRSHRVVTGVTLMSADNIKTFSVTTNVEFDRLAREDIESYVDKYQPFDKAGAYGIQEWIGCVGISSIDGCYYNVMGLPLHDLYRHLRNFH